MKTNGWEGKGSLWPGDLADNCARDKPALGLHRGKVWCIWQSLRYGIMYSNLDVKGETWFEPKHWPHEHPELPKKAKISPALVSANGQLHCVYSREEDGRHVYAVYMEKKQRWGVESLKMGSSSTGNLALAAFTLDQDAGSWLICVFQKSVEERKLYYQFMDPYTKRWGQVVDTGHSTNGSIDLTVINDEVWLIFGGLDDARQALVSKLGKFYKPFTPATPINQLSSAGYSWDVYEGSVCMAFRSRDWYGHEGGLLLAEALVNGNPLSETEDGLFTEIVTTPALRFADRMGICVWLIDEARHDANLSQHYSMKWARKVIPATGMIQVLPTTGMTQVLPKGFNWMSAIPDNRSVASLSIPGTHDSGTIPTTCITMKEITDALNFACCQSMPLSKQLESAIRYFDIRVRYLSPEPTVGTIIQQKFDPFGILGKFGVPEVPMNPLGIIADGLYIAHGPYYFQTLESAFDEFYSFLDRNPTEGILVQIKREGDGDETTTFGKVLDLIQSTQPSRWRLDQDLPTMGQIRGKIQLLRRCKGNNVGIDLTAWPGNTTQDYTAPFAHKISDQYLIHPRPSLLSLAIPVKIRDILSMMEDAQNCSDPKKLHITYTNFSASYHSPLVREDEKGELSFINPHTTAAGPVDDPGNLAADMGLQWRDSWKWGFNAALCDAVRERLSRNRPIGIIAMDFPESEPELIGNILRSNPDIASIESMARKHDIK